MEGLRGVEYLPEPSDRRIVSAVDPTVVGHENEWRSETMGWAPLSVEPIHHYKPQRWSISGVVAFALLVSLSLLMWQNQWLVVELPAPKSEWAFDASGIRDVQESGLTGEGVRVCMVDTGVDGSHEAFEGVDIVFKDLVGASQEPVDYGSVAHGTLMAGLLLSQDTDQRGSAPDVSFAMVAALQDNGDGENEGKDTDVADAIRWCQFDFQADIISLSLGGSQDTNGTEGDSSSATRQATDAGIYVVAAAGNDGLDDDGDVASPGSVDLAISVGATTQGGSVWQNSSVGASYDREGFPRQHPNMKPEVVAPGERIISTGQDNLWYSSSGTSDATVFVTGALALILQESPRLKAQANDDSACLVKVKQALVDSMAETAEGHDARTGYGQLDAAAWLNESQQIGPC